MKLSTAYIPVLKETPSEAQIVSHQLMLRAGLIRQLGAGMYTWLPLGLKVLQNISNVIRREMDAAGSQEILMSTLQPAELWQKSGRYESYGKEMLRFKDRHEREMLYGPTNEEVVTDLFHQTVKSYKALPQLWYQIQWKFRDEIRPRFGVMRGREFLMKDGYSFDLDYERARKTYETMFTTYLRIFKALGVNAVPVKADSGPIGGDLTHEFHILADTGESALYYDAAFEDIDPATLTLAQAQSLYAMADEMHIPENCPVPPERLKTRRGIEVGHIFYFATKYSEKLEAVVTGEDGQPVTTHMGAYGIGVSRLVGAIIEASHDKDGIIWPAAVAPFQIGLVNLKATDAQCTKVADELYASLTAQGITVLYDDKDDRVGAKLATMDLLGLPWQVLVGQKSLENGQIELKNRKTGEKSFVPLSNATAEIQHLLNLKL